MEHTQNFEDFLNETSSFVLNESVTNLWVAVAIDKKGSIVITSRPMVGDQAIAFLEGQTPIGARGEISALMLVSDLHPEKIKRERTVIGREYLK